MDVDARKVGRRLRAVMAAMGFKTTEAFADHLGQKRGAVDSWLNGRALPPVPHLTKLHRDPGITLDWLFYDDGRTMQHGVLIRLQGFLAGMDVPEVEEGIGPEEFEPEVPVAALPRPGRRKKTAT